MPLDAPQAMGDMLNQADCLGHTMIVAPTEFIDHIPTVNTKPGEKSPAVRVNVVDFADDPHNPTIYRGVLWFGVISGPLKRQIGQFLASRMGQGQASPGRNAPWQLVDVTGEQAWMDFMVNWLDNTDAGRDFQAETKAETARAASVAAVSGVAAAPAPAPAAAPAAPAPAPVAAPPATPAAPPAPAAPAPMAAPAPAAPAPNPNAALEALIATLPADQQAAARAIANNQGQAAH